MFLRRALRRPVPPRVAAWPVGRRSFTIPAMVPPRVKELGSFKVYIDGDTFCWVVMDPPDVKAVTLGSQFLDDIEVVTEYVEKEVAMGKAKVAIITSAKPDFCLGADVKEFYPILEEEPIIARIHHARRIMERLQSLSVPVVAAINGKALGGGLELAMGCDYRVCGSSPKAELGLPEIKLGVMPGLGGTVLTPRLIGLQAALANVLAGKSLRPPQARRAGLVDEVIESEDRFPGENRFLHGVRKFAGKKIDGPKRNAFKQFTKRAGLVDKILRSSLPFQLVVEPSTIKLLNKNTKGKYPAPYRAFDSIKNSLRAKSAQEAFDYETKAFAELCVSPVAKNIMAVFFLSEDCKKMDKQAAHFGAEDAVETTRMGVIGAGVMGSGIAHFAASKKVPVYMRDISDEAVQKGLDFVKKEFDTDKKKRKLNDVTYPQALARVQGGTDAEGFRDCEVIVEAAVERMDLKKKLLQELEAAGLYHKDNIFATNTSSLSINELAESSAMPENVVGMHFFNPVKAMPLVEIIKGKKTSKKAIATVYKLAVAMGKFPIVVNDGPGFLVNRVLGVQMAEAGRILTAGADPTKVDKMMVDFGLPMGPYRLLDEVGLDVAAHVGPILTDGLGSRFQTPAEAGIGAMVNDGRLGKKAGKGFYTYNEKGKQQGLDSAFQQSHKITEGFEYGDIVDRMVLLMVNEAAMILEEGIAASASDVDLGMIFGTGFAPFRGGLLAYADQRGVQDIVDRLSELEGRYGAAFRPCTLLKTMGEGGKLFFPDRPQRPYVELDATR